MSRPRDGGRALWTTPDRRLRSAVEVSLTRLPAVSVSGLHDGDRWLRVLHVVLDSDQMWMAGIVSVPVNFAHMIIALVGDRIGVWRVDVRGSPGAASTVVHMVRLLRLKTDLVSWYSIVGSRSLVETIAFHITCIAQR